MRNEKMFTVRNIKNGGIYVIGEEKLRKEPGEWETVIKEKPTVLEELNLNEEKVEVHTSRPTVKYAPKSAKKE